MQCDKSCFILRQRYFQSPAYQIHRVFPELEFLRIESFNFPEKRILQIDSLLAPVNGKIDMICQRNIDALIQLQLQITLCIGNNVTGNLYVLQRHVGQQLLQLFCHALALDPEHFLDFRFLYLLSCPDSESDPSAHHHNFFAFFIKG